MNTQSGWRQYRRLAVHKQARWLLVSGLVARLPLSMYGLAILLLVQQRSGGFTDAGLVAGAAAVGYAVGGPVLGRLVDRFGQTRTLRIGAVVSAAAFSALLAAAANEWSLGVLTVCGALVGITLPPVAACQRSLWPLVLPDDSELRHTALAVDAMSLDLFLIVGPTLVTVLVAVASPEVTLAVVGGLLVVGTGWLSAQPHSRRAQPSLTRRRGFTGPLTASSLRALLVSIGVTGFALGALRIGLLGYADAHHILTAGGLLFTMLGVGSLAGGLVYGARTWRRPVADRYRLLLAGFAMAVLPTALPGPVAVMAVLAILAGVLLAPVTICEFSLVPSCAPPGTVTEAYAWSIAATFAGAAAGTAAAGPLVDATGWRSAVLTAGSALL
ncbi:MAG: MFS transporter, partial [Pseudonocardiaceae bacterium]